MFVLPYIFNALFFIEMMFFGIFLVYIGLRNKGKHPYGCNSSLVSAVQVFVIVFAITFVSPFPRYPGMFPYPYSGFLQLWTAAWLAITAAFYLKVRREGGKSLPRPAQPPMEEKPKEPREPEDPNCTTDDGLKYKHEKARKAFHLAGLLVVLSYFLVAPLLSILANDWIKLAGPVYEALWGPISEVDPFSSTNIEQAAITLTLLALTATTILVLFVDTFRLLAGEEYSIIKLVERRAGKILRDKERTCPGAQDYIAIGSTCAWLIGMAFQSVLGGLEAIYIALAAIMTSTMADGAAAIVGKSYGRHKVRRPGNQVKSIEGFIAGFVVAFICCIFLTNWNWVVALVIAAVFLLIDYWSPPVSDNAINSVALTVVGCLVAMLF